MTLPILARALALCIVFFAACARTDPDDDMAGTDAATSETGAGTATAEGSIDGSSSAGEAVDPRVDEILALVGDAAAGEMLYVLDCADGCHLYDGTGATSGGLGKDLTEWLPRNDDVALVSAVLVGASPMPAFGGYLSAQEIADVAAYVRIAFE